MKQRKLGVSTNLQKHVRRFLHFTLGNWVDVNRFVHPALWDCLAAYRAVMEHPNVTVKILDLFFTRHLENRAAAVQTGAIHLWGKQRAN